MRPAYYYLLGLIGSFLTATIGGSFTVLDEWYYSLEQPGWKPDDLVFPVVWTTIFFLCAISVGILLNGVSNRGKKIQDSVLFYIECVFKYFLELFVFLYTKAGFSTLGGSIPLGIYSSVNHDIENR